MTLDELITELESRDLTKEVKHGFGTGMSYRGSYDEAAFVPVESTTFGDMLKHARDLLDTELIGYKGGEFTMHCYVDTHIAEYGHTGEPITSYNFKYWDVC